jgi:hypothetical protein
MTTPVLVPPGSMRHVPRADWTSQVLGTLGKCGPTELAKLCSVAVGGEVSVMQSSASVWAPHSFAGMGSAEATPAPSSTAVKSIAQDGPGVTFTSSSTTLALDSSLSSDFDAIAALASGRPVPPRHPPGGLAHARTQPTYCWSGRLRALPPITDPVCQHDPVGPGKAEYYCAVVPPISMRQ